MKILVVSHSCATSINRRLYRELARATGWDISLAVPAGWKDEFGNTLSQPADENFPGTVWQVPVALNGNIILHTYLKRWRAFLQRERFDAVYMNHEPYGLATAHLCRACLPLPVAFGFYSCQNIAKSYPFPFSTWEKMVYRRSDFAFPISPTVADVLREKGYAGPLAVAPLPVDLEDFHPRRDSENHALIPRSAGEVVLGYAGRVVEPKGLRTLAEALGMIRDLRWRFSIVGAGPFEKEFEDLLTKQGVRDRVTFHGYVPHDQSSKYLSALDILVLPSETQPNWKEQFGRVIPEALASGAAVAGSDSGEIPTLIRSSEGGIVFPEKNPERLADALRRLIIEPEMRHHFAATGRRWVEERLSLPAVAAGMAMNIESAILKRRAGNAARPLRAESDRGRL